MLQKFSIYLSIILCSYTIVEAGDDITLNLNDTGYRGIWYMNQPSKDEYVYKYSGGLGTYCAKHQPFAVYCEKVNRTYFCYGGTSNDSIPQLLHMVSYFDHDTKKVPQPTILLNKHTKDAHDNPVIAMDDQGYIWIFSTSHGTSRPSYIHKSSEPYDIDHFQLVPATHQEDNSRLPIDNFSYMQAWYASGHGFICFFTRYSDPAKRTLFFMTSSDGVSWSGYQRLAAIEEGHYQISTLGKAKAGCAFNYHPQGKGLNWRTNLYFMETIDHGKSWQSVDGTSLTLPLTQVKNPALVYDYQAEGLNVYLKDICYDDHNQPVILYLTSKGYESGPKNDPRTWCIARWIGNQWQMYPITTSDNNYDMGSLWITENGQWHIIAPTEAGPQPYNTGGEVVHWLSSDSGKTLTKTKQLTRGSKYNHSYVRRPVNAHPDFFAFWADGHSRQPSESNLYFCDLAGNVYILPRLMKKKYEKPILLYK